MRKTVPTGHTFTMDKIVIDEDTKAIAITIKFLLKDLRARGLNDDQIDTLIDRNGPSRITLNREGITLPDYDNVNIRLNPTERTLYTLILKYDNGIAPDDICKYYDELYIIYKKHCLYDDEKLIEGVIHTLCDKSRSTLGPTVSRIKRKLVEKIGKNAADHYAIIRGKDNIYRIAVPRDLVLISK